MFIYKLRRLVSIRVMNTNIKSNEGDKMKEKNNAFAHISIVAIIGIVAIIVMLLNTTNTRNAPDLRGDLIGDARHAIGGFESTDFQQNELPFDLVTTRGIASHDYCLMLQNAYWVVCQSHTNTFEDAIMCFDYNMANNLYLIHGICD